MNAAILIICIVLLLGCAAAMLGSSRKWSKERAALLAANEDLARRAFFVEDTVQQPMVMFDERGLIRRVNRAAQDLFGYRESDLAGRNILRLIPVSPAAKGGIAEVRCQNDTRLQLRFRAIRSPFETTRDTYLFFESTPTPANSPPKDTVPAPEKRPLFDARPSLAAVEQVVGRIVQQFESLLTSISGHTELAMRSVGETSPARVDLAQLAEASDTASNLARNLLAFTGKQTIPITPIDLNAVLRNLQPQIRSATRQVHVELAEDRAVVLANVDCLQQIILLLCRVAQNRSEGEQFRVSIARHTYDAARAVYTGRVPEGNFCTLTVSDTGPELALSTMAHLFEPLYLDPENIGVELAPVYGIVRTLGGWINVVSTESGTAFEIILPYGGDAQVGSNEGWKLAKGASS